MGEMGRHSKETCRRYRESMGEMGGHSKETCRRYREHGRDGRTLQGDM